MMINIVYCFCTVCNCQIENGIDVKIWMINSFHYSQILLKGGEENDQHAAETSHP